MTVASTLAKQIARATGGFSFNEKLSGGVVRGQLAKG